VITENSITRTERVQAPIYTFTILRKNGNYEDVNSCFVEFTAHHIIFRNSKGQIDYGIHADEVRDITQGDHA